MKAQDVTPARWPEGENGRMGRPFGADLVVLGSLIILGFLAVFGAWARFVPIESAVVAPGVVSVDSNVRTVQHLEGGIVSAIKVREGEKVSAGQVLIQLKNTMPTSSLNEVRAQYYQALATAARLTAERDGLDEIEFPDVLSEKVGDEAALSAMAGQRNIFETRRTLRRDRLQILQRKNDGIEAEIGGIERQIRATRRRLEIVEEDLATKRSLYQQKLIQRPKLLDLESEQAELEGQVGQYEAAIGSARQRLAEAELAMTEFEAELANEIVEGLRIADARAYELGQRNAAAQDVLRRTEIRSPIDGIVVDLGVHTVGGVISSGEPLLNVVPINDKLIVRATIDPLDIDRVRKGMAATAWLSAMGRRAQSGISAVVETVSADRLIDPRSGAPYYMARIVLDGDAIERSAIPLQAGMGAEVMISTGARTTWDYVSAPIFRNMSRALREN